MKNMAGSKKYSTVIAILVGIVMIGIIFVVLSEPGRNLGLDIFFDVISKSVLFLIVIPFLKKKWPIWNSSMKWGWVLAIGLMIFATIHTVIDGWPRLPWVKAKAFIVIDQFMNDLKVRDYDAAITKLAEDKKCVSVSELSQPDAQPISWELSPFANVGVDELRKSSRIVGSAVFSDNKEEQVLIWVQWLDNRWQITGVLFGLWPDERLDFVHLRCQ